MKRLLKADDDDAVLKPKMFTLNTNIGLSKQRNRVKCPNRKELKININKRFGKKQI